MKTVLVPLLKTLICVLRSRSSQHLEMLGIQISGFNARLGRIDASVGVDVFGIAGRPGIDDNVLGDQLYQSVVRPKPFAPATSSVSVVFGKCPGKRGARFTVQIFLGGGCLSNPCLNWGGLATPG